MRASKGRRALGLALTVPGVAVLCVGLGAVPALGQEGENPGFMTASGRITFQTYCASCHGEAADGTGRVAKYLTVRPPDLTKIRERYDGVFPRETIYEVIDGRTTVRTHGSADMPIWGDVFRSSLANLTPGATASGEERAGHKIRELVYYLESIQVEPVTAVEEQ